MARRPQNTAADMLPDAGAASVQENTAQAAIAAVTDAPLSTATDDAGAPAAVTIGDAVVTPSTTLPTSATAPVDALLPDPRPLDVSSPVLPALAGPLATSGTLVVSEPSLVIVSREPGFRRANHRHPAVKIWPLDAFTARQLRQIEEEPMLELIAIGGTPVASDAPAADQATD